MSFTKSAEVCSSQTAVHANLNKVVDRHLNGRYQNSIPKHTYDAFKIADKFVQERDAPIILDSGCGTGESTYHMAKYHPDCVVIGLDKSENRLQRYNQEILPNQLILHADCVSFWQLAVQNNWRIKQHYLLYPNPWPKPGHLQRRWHAHPVFPELLKLGGILVMRTNWKIYAQEFVRAIKIILKEDIELKSLGLCAAMTAHERKYMISQHQLYEVNIDLVKAYNLNSES